MDADDVAVRVSQEASRQVGSRQVDKGHAVRLSTLSLSTCLLLLPLGFLALFYFYPVISIARLSLAPSGTLDLPGLEALVSSSYYLRTLWFTTWQATASTALTL